MTTRSWRSPLEQEFRGGPAGTNHKCLELSFAGNKLKAKVETDKVEEIDRGRNKVADKRPLAHGVAGWEEGGQKNHLGQFGEGIRPSCLGALPKSAVFGPVEKITAKK